VNIVRRAACGAVALALLSPIVAGAQSQRNPFAELLGRVPERSGQVYTGLDLRSTAGAQWGMTLEEDFVESDAVLPDGLSGGADVSMNATYQRDRVQALGQGRISYQEYRTPPAFGAPAYDGSGRVNFEATNRLSFHGGGLFQRAPFYQLAWLEPDLMTPMAAGRSAILLLQNDTIAGDLGFTSQYAKHSSLMASVTARRTEFTQNPGNTFTATGARVMWRRSLRRDLTFHAGYGRESVRQPFGDVDHRFVSERTDIGVDYSKAISVARRTMLSFGTETSLARESRSARVFRLNGHIDFTKRFQRTWQFRAGAERATEYLPGFRAPVFSERGRLSLAGFVAKRLVLNMNADGGQGQVGFNDSRKFISYTGDAKLTFAMTRHFGVFTQYVYYHFGRPPDSAAFFGLPQVARQAFSVGVQTWVPLIDKEQVSSDPR